MSTLDAPTTSVCHYGMKRLAILLPWRAASAVLLTVFAFINKAPAGELTALVTLGPIEITLIDLAPEDGMAPSFRWTQNAWTGEIERQAYFHVNNVGSGIAGFDNPLRTHLAGDMITTLPGEASYAQILGDLQGLEVFLTMAPGPTPRSAIGNAEFNLDPTARYHSPGGAGTGEGLFFGSDYTFELSPHTAAVFTSVAHSTVQNTTNELEAHRVSASAFLHAGYLESVKPADYSNPFGIPWYPHVHDGSGVRDSGRDSFSISNSPTFTTWVAENSATQTLSVRFDNATNSGGAGYFYAGARAQIDTAAVTVPEPSSVFTSILAFAGCFIFLQRRRRWECSTASPTFG